MAGGNVLQTAESYIGLVRTLGAMTDTALDGLQVHQFLSDNDKQKTLARAAEVVETISSLRGDSALFDSQRPDGLAEYQGEMYTIEDALRSKLLALGYVYPAR